MENKQKIAIIGGGPGGLYTAMRLLESGHDPDCITIFEATAEFGGRVRTLPLKDCPFSADIGAMRYIKDRQLLINSLVDKFDLANANHDVPLFGHYLRGTTILPYVKPNQHSKMWKPDDGHGNSKSDNPVTDESHKLEDLPDQDAFVLNDIENLLSPQELIGYAILKAFTKLSIDHDKVPTEYEDFKFDVEKELLNLKDSITVYNEKTNERRFDNIKIKGVLKTFSFDSFTLNEWHVIRNAAMYHDTEYGNQYLYETCLFNILQRELSTEAVTLSQDALGYSSVFGSANAADLIPWFLNEFGNQTYKTITNGMSELIFKFVDRIDELMKSRSKKQLPWNNFKYKLLSVKKEKGNYKLRFEDIPKLITADKIIFSVSKGALERIHFDHTFKIDPDLGSATGGAKLGEVVQAVTAYPLLKAFLFFESDWFWSHMDQTNQEHFIKQYRFYEANKEKEEKKNELHRRINFCRNYEGGHEFVSTRILTDLPIRQIYFHGPQGVWYRPDAPENAKKLIKGMIMAYGDSRQAEYWTSLAGRNSASDEKTRFKMNKFTKLFPNNEIKKLIAAHGVSNSLINMLMMNIREVLRGSGLKNVNGKKTEPIAVFMQDWNEAPFYGGWHAWCVNYNPWEVRKHIQRPFVGQDIFISGEVFSPDQGWIEGALRISESILQSEHFGLTSPEWIERNVVNLHETSWHDSEKPNDTIKNYLKW